MAGFARGKTKRFQLSAKLCSPAEALVVLSHGEAYFLLHVHVVLAGSGLNEGPVKEVPIVSDINSRFDLQAASGMPHRSAWPARVDIQRDICYTCQAHT